MDPAKLLDILGNENRRKIIQLLANRPCYVSEISGRLGVGPKAIISHLSLLEQAGMIEFSVDDQRRKYFNIANNMRLEVSVSPYAYTMSLQDIDFDREKKGERSSVEKKETVARDESSCFFLKLNGKLRELKERQEELVQMQKQLQVEYMELMDRCLDSIEEVARNPVECELLFELLKNEATPAVLCYNLRLHPSIITSNLMDLAERGFVEYTIKNNQQYWRICETGVDNK
ncbi:MULTISPECIES: ArsR family transcriptional regulator [unclassified Methanosarcina]|uniref:ArsR/SmtB family transcription factor n=1 Tax=unclassified Methanosarcina TaxID=2644672 RepID=UPI000615E960|nr:MULTISPECIES: ArsR family transcriptional regulator [unclassified Methanosarcina]AKB16932.1 Archaeal heat shock regulator, ArsR family [Methanosarcina sp. WWM596]AKB20337.1 Archaeal heat shock regulator, ArsR family [Methanosarcina sp. WH1]